MMEGAGMHNGYAVIDFETTGLSPNYGHRIIEIGIVHVSPDGAIERSFETVLNPGRDLGPVHIHQIRGRDVIDAPTFADIASTLVDLLRGRVLVAHNARFEVTFLAAEFARLGLTSPVGVDEALCTMRLASEFLPGSGRKLADCCAAFDIDLTNAHEALGDATATALLLAAYLEGTGPYSSWGNYWNAFGATAAALPWPALATVGAAWIARQRGGSVAPTAPTMLDRATDRLPALSTPDPASPAVQYAAMLDRALADGLLSVHETDELADLARSFGMSDPDREALHAGYFADLVAAAWEDSVLTDDERREIETVATLLDIAPASLEAALNDPRPMATAVGAASGSAAASTDSVGDTAGATQMTFDETSIVVLTGEMRRPRDVIEADIERLGIRTARAVTKKTTLLVAADVDSLSGKARKARQYGIPVASEEELEAALASASAVSLR
jgi:DNA polymerase III subunit epsilon